MTANTEHPCFGQPVTTDGRIWRYLDFAKLVALLQTRDLHFPRLDQLADPFEGSLSKSEYEHWMKVAAAGEVEGSLPFGWQGKYFDMLMLNARRARQTMYVNCWYSGDEESEAMWKLYANTEYAVAVQSTYGRLVEVLPANLKNGCYVGVVSYLDHDFDAIPTGNVFYPVMHKRRAFAHEREVRAVVWYGDRGQNADPDLSGNPLGLGVNVSLEGLIERIVVSPTAAPWFTQAVQEVLKDYRLSVPVEQSTLARKPYL